MTLPLPDLTDEKLAARLSALTQPQGSSPDLWLRALSPSRKPRAMFTRRIPARWLTAAAALLLVMSFAAISLPSLGHARGRSGRLFVTPSTLARSPAPPEPGEPAPGWSPIGFPQDSLGLSGIAPATSPSDADLPRRVIRKATLELATPDVRAALLKAALILNLAAGEYTEQSSLTGEGPTAHATLTLRVAADRLSEALNQLRALGKVTSEQLTGDDVTDQAVDLEARLRNEQRIESELLSLLDTRTDAPLEDILKVRTELSKIRENIERLTAQRDRLSHLVSLATILVIIRADGAPPPTPEAGIWDYFMSSIASSWHAGLNALADTIAFLIRTAIGGLVWWLLILSIAIAAIHSYRRARARTSMEPAPTE